MNHAMELKQEFASGAQRWWCPICGREFIIQYPPHYSKVVIFEGDTNIPHVGGQGVQVEQVEAGDPHLAPFSRWLKDRHLLS